MSTLDVVIHTRYSTEMQREDSCEDQERNVRGRVGLGLLTGAADRVEWGAADMGRVYPAAETPTRRTLGAAHVGRGLPWPAPLTIRVAGRQAPLQ